MKSKISRREFNATMAAGALGLIAGCGLNTRFDIIVQNGLVIDGSGIAGYHKDIGLCY